MAYATWFALARMNGYTVNPNRWAFGSAGGAAREDDPQGFWLAEDHYVLFTRNGGKFARGAKSSYNITDSP